MFGNIVLSVIIGVASAVVIYIAYGTANLKAQIGKRRLQYSVMVGVIAALLGFGIRYMDLL